MPLKDFVFLPEANSGGVSDDNRKPKDSHAESKNAILPHFPLFFVSAGKKLNWIFVSAENELD